MVDKSFKIMKNDEDWLTIPNVIYFGFLHCVICLKLINFLIKGHIIDPPENIIKKL